MPANRRSDSSCAAFSVVPGYARAFGAAYPDVVLNLREVSSNDLAAQVLAGQIDAAIMFPGLANKNLAIRTIVSEPLCVALSRTHPRARARQLRTCAIGSGIVRDGPRGSGASVSLS
jgi:DNA-binding transcriptional LysR family regulator